MTMMSFETEKEGLRQRVRRRYHRFRNKSQDPSKSTQPKQLLATDVISALHSTTGSILYPNETIDVAEELIGTGRNGVLDSDSITNLEQEIKFDQLSLHNSISNVHSSSDIWSAAYREAVESLGEEITNALSGKNANQLFKELEEIEHEATHESAFLRGVQRLRSLKTPLDNFKLALDLASPLANLEPTASTVFGVVRSVTAIAITFANADLDFAKQIADMLEKISYIDECDTLGRKVDRKDIHKALVSVYQKILEFYDAALKILTRKGAKLVMRMILENDRLPTIVQEFLTSADKLQMVIQKASLDILKDIQAVLYKNEIARWLGKENLSRQSDILNELQKFRANQACEFLLENPSFQTWYNAPDSQQLVVLGDMGHGKSTAMAFLAERLSQRNKYRLPRPVLCQYYCRHDETGKATSVLSGLIHSLVNQLRGLQKPFYERYQEAQASCHFDPASNSDLMESFLQDMLRTIDRPVIIVIDGVDECDDDSRNRLLKFLKSATQTASGLKVIFSSRPGEEILGQLGDMARIELGSDPERDRIIVNKKLEMLPYLAPDVKALVGEELAQRAQGSAIWIRMIIELIKLRRLMAKHSMERFLEEISLPEELSKVYVSLLSRSTSDDHENLQLAITALRILAVSHRSLSMLELAWAVALSLAQDVRTVDALAKLVDHQRVMALIYPFIASPDYDELRKPQVRLTHQSVKEWVFTQADSEVSASTAPGQLHHASKSLDAFMLDICIKYLLLDDIGNNDLFSEEQAAFAELPRFSESSSDDEESCEYDPKCTWESWEEDMDRFDPVDRGFGEFFVYASCHWVDHLGCLTIEPLPSLASIETLCQAGSTRLRNWIQQNCRPGCAMSPRYEFDSSLYDPLSITSMYASEPMLLDMLGKSNFDSDKFLQGSALRAADQILQWGSVARLKILFLNDRTGQELQNFEFFRLVIKRWDESRVFINPWHKEQQNWDLVFDLVDNVAERLTEEQWGNDLLCLAASAGCMPLVRRLMTSAQRKMELRNELLRSNQIENQSPFDNPTHQSIGQAVLGNHVDIVQYLLQGNGIEAHLRYRNSRGENVLHLASRICNPEMFRLLIPRFPEGINEKDVLGNVPLLRIIMSPLTSRYESANVFLSQSGANSNSHSLSLRGDYLRAAVSRLDLEMCCILIWIGNINPVAALACGNEGQMSLKEGCPKNEVDLLGTLVDLFFSESEGDAVQLTGSVEEALRNVAEKHYARRFQT